MADTKISALADGSPLRPSDLLVVARGGGNNRIDGDDVTALHARDASTVDVTNTTTETTIFSYAVPANELGTARKLRCEMGGDYLNNNGVASTLRLRLKYGGTTIFDDIVAVSSVSATRRPWYLMLSLCANGAAGAQSLFGFMLLGTAGGATAGLGDIDTDEVESMAPFFGTSAVDSTVSQTLEVTATWSTANAGLSLRRFHAGLERL
jgi:hypothetical protein